MSTLRCAAALAVLILFLPALANAQVEGPPETPAPDAAPQPTPELSPLPASPPEAPVSAEEDADIEASVDLEEDDFDAEGEVIRVTGSAIERSEVSTPAPVSVLNKADLEASGLVSVGDILQDLPEQSNAINVQHNNGGDGSTRVSLRGLGEDRTLVLLNGRRHVPGGTGANASVDLNAIPLAIIERVEVLKDGASAIYGSEAIGGVVNIITRKDFDGVEASVYTGTTQRGGGTVYDVSAVAGHRTKRGGIVFAAGFFENRPIMAGQRGFSTADKSYDFETGEVSTSGSTAVPAGYINVRGDDRAEIGNAAWEGLRANDDHGVYTNDPNGGWRRFNATGNSDVGEGDFYNYQPENYLVTPQRRYNVYSAGDYRVHEHAKGFFEASYTHRDSDQQLAATPLFTRSEDITLSARSIHNPFGRDFKDVRRRILEAGNRKYLQDVNTFRVVTGVEGDLPDSLSDTWKWNIAFNYGRTQGTEINEGRFIRSRVAAALGPSFIDGNGKATCGTPQSPGADDCVPLNLLGGVGTITPEMLDYIQYTGIARGFTEQTSVSAGANGLLFKTPWNGDVRVALGAVFRREAGGLTPDPLTSAGDTTGVKQQATEGDYQVGEGFAELSIVPVAGHTLAEWVELSAAARVFSYSTFGTDYTWKAGGLWRPGGGLSVRGTYSTAFRAPSIGELYGGKTDDFPNVSDPCDTTQGPRTPIADRNCRADGVADNHLDDRTQIRSEVGGNPDLQPETAKIFTVGTVYEPTFLEGLALTVDYFNVTIDNALQPQGANIILSNCYSQENRTDCEKVNRDAGGFLVNLVDPEANIGGSETSGVDFGIRYHHSLPIGTFRHNLEGTWLHKYDEILGRRISGKGVYDLGVYPDWKFNASTAWNNKNWGAGANVRFINSFKECQDNDCSGDNPSRRVDEYATGDVYASYNVKTAAGRTLLTVGVNNVIDTNPVQIFNGFLATSDASTYDFLGRFYYMRLSQSF